MNKQLVQRLFLSLAIVLNAQSMMAAIRLPQLFTDNMVIQHGSKVHVWGTATPNEKVSVSLFGNLVETVAKADGSWEVWFRDKLAGQRGELIVTSGMESIKLKNIIAGEVWICSGQSNMEFPLSSFKGYYEKEIKNSANNWIRYATVQNLYSNREETDAALRIGWTPVDENTVGNCSAVAYFFARKLYERLKVPIGIIISSWGGTPAQAWMDETGIKDFANYAKAYDKGIKPLDFSKLNELKQKSEEAFRQKSSVVAASFKEYLQTNYDDSGWEEVTLPGVWENAGHPDFDGLAAYRISFTLPPGSAGKEAVLHLPAIDDIDSTYINGQLIGTHRVWNELRTYKIGQGVLKDGKNMLTIWVEDGQGGGGLNNDPANYYIEIQNNKIPLKGTARLKLLLPLEQSASGVNLSSVQNSPCVLFNAMIAPLLPLSFRGVIWYQGESNVSQYEEYRTLFPAMITRWRKRFGKDDMPFLFAQLSSYNPAVTEPVVSEWALLREAQTMTLQLPNTGMAVTTDVGDQFDIHPIRKKEVGERLAANAITKVYGAKNEIASGPVFNSTNAIVQAMQVFFDDAGSGLMIKGENLKGFSLAGEDKVFYPANGTIYGVNSVIISSDKVKDPVYVRYAWADAPLEANLYNKEGFPAIPFRTDK